MMRGLKIYRINLKYFYKNIQLLWFMVAENEIADDYISYKIGNKQNIERR